MNMKKKLKIYGISCCMSYTFASTILSLLNSYSELITFNVWNVNLQLFIVCLAIAVLMLISDLTIFRSKDEDDGVSLLQLGVDLFDVAVPVLGLGGPVFHWFDLFSVQILSPILILVAVYLIVFALFYWGMKQTEKELNIMIRKRKEMMKHDEENN